MSRSRLTAEIIHSFIHPADYEDEVMREAFVASMVAQVDRGEPDGRADYYDEGVSESSYVIALSWGVNPFAWTPMVPRPRVYPKTPPRGAQRSSAPISLYT